METPMNVRIRSTEPAEIRYRLDVLEKEHGMPSSEFVDAFKNGRLDETSEFRLWARLYAAWSVSTGKS
jgi:hypothetical protein